MIPEGNLSDGTKELDRDTEFVTLFPVFSRPCNKLSFEDSESIQALHLSKKPIL